jgi:hypothetical protein
MEPAAGVGVECKAQARRKEHAAPGEGLIASNLLRLERAAGGLDLVLSYLHGSLLCVFWFSSKQIHIFSFFGGYVKGIIRRLLVLYVSI